MSSFLVFQLVFDACRTHSCENKTMCVSGGCIPVLGKPWGPSIHYNTNFLILIRFSICSEHTFSPIFFFIFSYFHQLHVLKFKKKNHKSYNAENLLSWQTAGFVKCDNVPSQLRHQQVYIMNRIFYTSKAFDIGYYRLQVFFYRPDEISVSVGILSSGLNKSKQIFPSFSRNNILI